MDSRQRAEMSLTIVALYVDGYECNRRTVNVVSLKHSEFKKSGPLDYFNNKTMVKRAGRLYRFPLLVIKGGYCSPDTHNNMNGRLHSKAQS